MATPSLVIVPDRYKADKLYSQIPVDGTGDFLVTRGTTATRVNASGLIESVASGVPRIDYTGGGCGKLLVEPAATNQIRNNTGVGAVTGTPGTLPTNWTEFLGGLTREVVASGTENGIEYVDIKLSGIALSNNARIAYESNTQIVASFNQVWTNSAYIKIISEPSPPVNYNLSFREGLSGGTFVAIGVTQISPTSELNRFSATRTLTGATTQRVEPSVYFNLTIGSTYDFTIRIGLPQIELGAVATSVIKTSTVAVTRNADVISLSSASGLIGQTEGVIYAEVDLTEWTNAMRVFAISDDSQNNRIAFLINTTNRIRALVTQGGSTQADFNTSTGLSNGKYKIALAYAANDFVFYVNGSQIGTDTSGSVPACSSVYLGKLETSSTTLQINDRISAAALYTTRLSDPELIALTTL